MLYAQLNLTVQNECCAEQEFNQFEKNCHNAIGIYIVENKFNYLYSMQITYTGYTKVVQY